jgi:solute:Na+ symporter, SSS family
MNLEFLSPMGFSLLVNGVYEIPFLDRMAFVFILCVIGMIIISIYENANGVKPKGLEIDATMFKPSTSFTVGALIIVGLLIAVYTAYY